MAKVSRTPRQSSEKSARPVDTRDAKIGRINTWQDVADVEDEFHMNRDRISLEEDEDLRIKRRMQSNDAFDDPSDEEVLGLEELPSSSEDEDGYDGNPNDTQFSEDEEEVGEDDPDAGGWGTSKRDYYNADEVENDEDAAEEEAEARRLQAKQLASISVQDFIFDEDEWKDPDEADEEQELVNGVAATSLAALDPDATAEEREKLLDLLHPEFRYLANEFVDLEPVLDPLSQKLAKYGRTKSSNIRAKHTVLSTYLGVLSMYFALLTRERPVGEMSNVKEHKVMDALLKCRQAWLKVADLKDEVIGKPAPTLEITNTGITDITNGKRKHRTPEERAARADRKRKRESDPTTLLAEKRRAQRTAKTEAELADLDDLLQSSIARKSQPTTIRKPTTTTTDFGEDTYLFADDADEKAKRKKSLRFYTSQIAQKEGKRNRAGRDMGGDMDVPHKERERERKDRLLAEAIKKGQSTDGPGVELGDSDPDEDDTMTGLAVRAPNEDEEYYNLIASQTAAAKSTKKLIYDAERAGERVVETEIIDPTTGKRAIGYTIEKNKGLTPHRKKDVRNPRVKKRKKYEAAKKKLGSKKAIYKTPTGAYGGETTGIKTRLVKSVKFRT